MVKRVRQSKKRSKEAPARPRAGRSAPANLQALIADATVEEKFLVPFTTRVLGMEVVVERIDINDAGDIVAICRRGR
jgi:hypothetical protein